MVLSPYLGFLAVALGVPIAVAAVLAGRRTDRPGHVALGVAAMVAIAVVYTAPWDSHLIGRTVWWYGEGVVGRRIGDIPFGEYLFFGLQTAFAALTVNALLPEVDQRLPASAWFVRGAGLVGWSAVALVGRVVSYVTPGYYLGMILVWAAPVAAMLWGLGGPVLWRYRRAVAGGIALPTLYLWAVDRTAIGLGLWTISGRYSTGVHLLGLPVEEAVFFLLTNVLVVQGTVLFRWVAARTERGGLPYGFGGLLPWVEPDR